MNEKENLDDLIVTRLRQAEACIADVDLCLANSRYPMAVNRIYYGIFYALLALALLHNFKTSKHLQLIGWFNKNFVYAGIFPNYYGKIVKKAYDSRANSDYDIAETLPDTDFETQFSDMKTFISAVKAYLEEQLRQP